MKRFRESAGTWWAILCVSLIILGSEAHNEGIVRNSKSNSRVAVEEIYSPNVAKIRRKRATAFTAAEITQIVDEHNAFRRSEGASDAEEVVSC